MSPREARKCFKSSGVQVIGVGDLQRNKFQPRNREPYLLTAQMNCPGTEQEITKR